MDSDDALKGEVGRIAHALGKGWRLTYKHDIRYIVYLAGPDGADLSVRVKDGDRSKLTVGGGYPNDPTRRVSPRYHRINVSRNRAATAITADIKRRLMPDYLTELARVRAAIAENLRDEQNRDRLLDRIEAALPRARRHGDEVTAYGLATSMSATVRTNIDGTQVTALDLRWVPVDLAMRIVKLVGRDLRTAA